MFSLRSTLLVIATAAASALMAQVQYFVNISGHHTPCDATVQNSFVHIESVPGTSPAIDIDVPINANCYYTVTLELNSLAYGFMITSGCATPTTTTVLDSLPTAPPLGTTLVMVVDFDCSVSPVDCLGIPGGSALPGTSCITDIGVVGMWSANCQCMPTAPNCQACFMVGQASDGGGNLVPYQAVFTSCSVEDGGNYNYNWVFPDGSAGVGAITTWTVPGEGIYPVCLWMEGTDNNCVNTFCDTIYVDANGTIQSGPPSNYDCLGVLNGPDLPGAPCTVSGTGLLGTWNAMCECIPNVTLPCEAAFWVMQAYEIVPVGNDTTMVQPIPFELWIWNQSSGGTGNYQFTWDFGDGTVSTDAFPTHVYGASGPYEICLTMTDDAGCTDTFCDEVNVDQDGILGMTTGGEVRSALTVKVIDSLPTSVSEQANLEATNLWPNPVNEGFTLALNSSRSGTLTFDVVDLQGKVVRSQQFGVSTGSNRLTMDTHGIDAGLYMLRVSNGQHSTSLRFVKQ